MYKTCILKIIHRVLQLSVLYTIWLSIFLLLPFLHIKSQLVSLSIPFLVSFLSSRSLFSNSLLLFFSSGSASAYSPSIFFNNLQVLPEVQVERVIYDWRHSNTVIKVPMYNRKNF